MQIDLWMNSWTRGWADMNTMINVIRAVSGLVEQVFGAPPTTKDITEGFNRPCTYVQPTLMQTSLKIPSPSAAHSFSTQRKWTLI